MASRPSRVSDAIARPPLIYGGELLLKIFTDALVILRSANVHNGGALPATSFSGWPTHIELMRVYGTFVLQ